MRLSEALNYHMKEGELLTKERDRLLEENNNFREEKEVTDLMVQEKVVQVKQQKETIKEVHASIFIIMCNDQSISLMQHFFYLCHNLWLRIKIGSSIFELCHRIFCKTCFTKKKKLKESALGKWIKINLILEGSSLSWKSQSQKFFQLHCTRMKLF